MSSRASIAAGSVSGAASRSASRRAPPAVTVRSMAASSEPCRSPASAARELEIAPRRGIDLHDRAGGEAPRVPPAAAGAPSCVSLEIVDQGAAGGDLGPREAAEAIERRDREEPAPAAGARPRCRSAPPAAATAAVRYSASSPASSACWNRRSGSRISLGSSRASAAGELGRPQRLHREIAGRDIGPGERPCAPPAIGDRREEIVARASSSVSSVSVPGRHQAHHLAPDHRFGAALLGLGRVFDLLADRDPEALADQLGEIALGGMHRHAAHRDVLAVDACRAWSARCRAPRPPSPHPRRTARRNRPCGRTADSRDAPP